MTELLIKTEPQIAEQFKALTQEIYSGNEARAFREAVLVLVSLQQKRDTSRLRAAIDKIRSDIEAGGGLTAKQIDQLVRESRQRRKAAAA
ncbi:hypothetical protein HUU40_29760 [candidate division KSB1 bacterium]|nr:hypothetical protein [candidate division KSB1 bacterium]